LPADAFDVGPARTHYDRPRGSPRPPLVRGLRIRVADVLGQLSAGASREDTLRDFPYLENADIDAMLAFAARQADHPIIAAG